MIEKQRPLVWMVWVAWTAWMALAGGNAYTQVPAAGTPRAGGATSTGIAPPAEDCQLVVSEPDMNYGAMTRYRLEQGINGQEMSLGKRRIALSVSCRNFAARRQGRITCSGSKARL